MSRSCRLFNEATGHIPCWDEYETSRMAKVTLDCVENQAVAASA